MLRVAEGWRRGRGCSSQAGPRTWSTPGTDDLLLSIAGSPSTPATQISAKIGIDIDDGMGDT